MWLDSGTSFSGVGKKNIRRHKEQYQETRQAKVGLPRCFMINHKNLRFTIQVLRHQPGDLELGRQQTTNQTAD